MKIRQKLITVIGIVFTVIIVLFTVLVAQRMGEMLKNDIEKEM